MASERVPSDLTRRGVLRGAAVGSLSLPLLAACGSSTDTGSPSGGGGDGGSGGGGGGETPAAGAALVATSDVPVGGGTVVADAEVVVTQPTDGDFKCFTAICTHQGCVVGSVENGEIVCPCHGSRFSIEDGSVLDGPARSPLSEIDVTVEGDEVVRG